MRIEINDLPQQAKFNVKDIVAAMIEGDIDEFKVRAVSVNNDESTYLVYVSDEAGNKAVHRVNVNKRKTP